MPTQKGTVITISREHGSGGKLIGQLLADKLGIPCYYKEMVAVAAKESGLAKEFISNINADENAVMKDLYLSTEIVQNAITAQDKAIRKIADSGSCVIVGRNADYILREFDHCLRVFVHADRNWRLLHMRKLMPDTPFDQLEVDMDKADRARKNYCVKHTGRVYGDSRNYDLTLCTSKLGIDKALEILLCAAKDI